MRIRTISTAQIRRMGDQEGLILQGCGGDPQEWVDGINEILAKEGEQLARGDRIALVGSTGISTGPHLHFEVEVKGLKADPLQALEVTEYEAAQ